jgi:hypothetical protein
VAFTHHELAHVQADKRKRFTNYNLTMSRVQPGRNNPWGFGAGCIIGAFWNLHFSQGSSSRRLGIPFGARHETRCEASARQVAASIPAERGVQLPGKSAFRVNAFYQFTFYSGFA